MALKQHSVVPQQRRACYYSGRVQGVGFRYTVQNIAQRYNVHGYVRNLPDGRVELVVEGDQGEIDHLVDDVNQRMHGYIKGIDTNTLPATGEFDDFYIRH
jgi:acylphosphatase